MGENTKIEWAHHTFNPWYGCTKVGPGCDHCYAEGWANRSGLVQWGVGQQRRRTSVANWKKPLKWNAEAGKSGTRRRVFCASLADVFDNEVDMQWRIDLLELIAQTPNLDWLLLTKRIGNVERMLDEALDVMSHGLTRWRDVPWPNVWIGASIVNQPEADRDIPKLLAVPARVRFLSMEPLLGHVDVFSAITGELLHTSGNDYEPGWLDWIIVGGESGPQARPMNPVWVRSLRDQCAMAGVAFHFKQWGEHTAGELAPHPAHPDDTGAWRLDQRGERWHSPYENGLPRSECQPVVFIKVGKKTAGRLLDGIEHNGYPS